MSLASSVVNDCLRITEKDNVTVLLYPHSLRLAEDIAEECFKSGADVILNLYTDRYMASYHDLLSVESQTTFRLLQSTGRELDCRDLLVRNVRPCGPEEDCA